MVTATIKKLEERRLRLGMSKRVLAERSGISEPTVSRLLLGKEDAPSLRSLEAIADALGAELTVGVSFADDPLDFKRKHAEKKAGQLVGMVQATMGLESQAVDSETLHEAIEDSADDLLRGSSLRLWSAV